MQKILNFLHKNHKFTAPLLVTAVLAIPLYIWLRNDTNLPHWDMGRHLYNSLHYGRLWLDFVAGRATFSELLTAYFYYPPFLYQIAVLFYMLFGVSQDVAVLSNIFWIFILVFSLYNIGIILWNRKTAYLAIASVFAMPMIIGQMREFQLDLPLTAWVSLTYYLLLKFRTKFELCYAVRLGIVLGLGMLLKWTYLVFVLPLGLIFIIELFNAKKGNIKKVALATFIAMCLGAIICGIWYMANRNFVRADFVLNGVDAAKREGDPTGINLSSLLYYKQILMSQYLLLPLGLFAVLGVLATIFKKNLFAKNWQVLLIIVVIYVVFSLVPNKDPRYIMPIVPFLSIIMASSINIKFGKWWQISYASIVVVLLILNNASAAFALTGGRDIKLLDNNWSYILRAESYTNGAPREAVCDIEKVVAAVPPDTRARLVGSNPKEFNNWTLAYYLEKNGRIWAGEDTNIEDTDYWVVRLDKSPESKLFLFQYQDMGLVVKNINCNDKSLVIVLKKQL